MRLLSYFYFANFLFALGYALPLYINSSFLTAYVPGPWLGVVYAAGAVLALLALPTIPHVLRALGNYTACMLLVAADFVVTLGLGVAHAPWAILACFILDQALTPLILVTFDIFLERNSTDETTGTLRGIMLTVGNLAVLIAPPLTGILVGASDNYRMAFIAAAALLIPATIFLRTGFRNFPDARYEHPPFFKALAKLRNHRILWNPFMAYFLLQFFYSWMVIYTPIYLHEFIGFDWTTIGLIFAIMLSPFVLFELPIGRLADLFFGEKEFMTAGFLLAGVTTAIIPFVHSLEPLVWATLLFATRVGAASIEITSTAYFFKHVTAREADLIGFFRNAQSMAYIAGPLAASIALFVMPYTYLFSLLGLILIIGMRYALTLADTR